MPIDIATLLNDITPLMEYDGRLYFYRCLSVNRGGTPAKSLWGRGTTRYLTPHQVPTGEYPKLATPSQVLMGDYPKVPTPSWVQMGDGVPQGTYLPTRSRQGEGVPQGTYLPSPRIGQHIEYLICCGQ